MIRNKAWLMGAALSGAIVLSAFGSAAFAADIVEPGCVPAVSSLNGKLEAAGGYADMLAQRGRGVEAKEKTATKSQAAAAAPATAVP